MSVATELLVIVGLTLLNGLFSGAEIALVSVRRGRLLELAEDGHGGATAALRLREQPEGLLATVQVGITVIGATTSVFGGARLERPIADALRALGLGASADQLALVVVVALVSYLSLVLGELVPKSLALRKSERIALLASRPLVLLAFVARPLVLLLTASSNVILRPFRDRTDFLEARISAEELQQLVDEAAHAGSLPAVAGDIASRAIDLGRLPVEAVMVPRTRMIAFGTLATASEVHRRLQAKPHARYPVLSEDETEVAGYVMARELYQKLIVSRDPDAVIDLRAMARPVPFVPEGTRALDALRRMQESRTQIALVVDEKGDLSGLVSIEDVAEEVLGEILEEHEVPVSRIRPDANGAHLLRGDTPLHEIARDLDVSLEAKHGATTIGGLLTELAGHIPEAGERFEVEPGVIVEVLDATPRLVRSVRISQRVAEE